MPIQARIWIRVSLHPVLILIRIVFQAPDVAISVQV